MSAEGERDRWQEVCRIFDRLVELDPSAREAPLQRLAAEDPELFQEVESLLCAESEAPPWLDGAARDRFESLLDAEAAIDGELPERIGSYRVLEEIGSGGMGIVYLAEHESGLLEQRVALKLVRRDVDTEEILARFGRERLILARLEHPAIARLLDGGVAEDGRPFFAMELVEGEPITDYCETRRLSIAARLRLFATVCEAVQHAHDALVVHRDLKPANILVTEEGRPKLLDFGIAKLLTGADGTAENILQTAVGRRILTPEYAAPEQFAGAPVATAMDVYALGVVLFELLTGRRPGRGRHEAAPTAPSAAVRGADEGAVAAARRQSPQALERCLVGDLDAIVVTALRGDPAERYPSVRALSDDIERHLRGQAVSPR